MIVSPTHLRMANVEQFASLIEDEFSRRLQVVRRQFVIGPCPISLSKMKEFRFISDVRQILHEHHSSHV